MQHLRQLGSKSVLLKVEQSLQSEMGEQGN